ncbi:MAG: hypothetical protein OER83_04450 [Flavobacteriaceae bacterium]|nr:hypothetical protein [Flavobacteriaceae bacterium]
MGQKRKVSGEKSEIIQILLSHQKKYRSEVLKKGYKEECCKKYKKAQNKRCKRCPCLDLFKQVA